MNKFLKVKKRGERPLFFRQILVLLCTLFFCYHGVMAESVRQDGISISLRNAKLRQVFLEIEKTSSYKFVYNSKERAFDKKMDVSFKDETIRTILDYCLQETDYTYSMDNEYVVLKKKKQESKAKKKEEIKGKVTDEKGNPMPGVTVIVKGTDVGTATDSKGEFTLMGTKGEILVFTFIGMIPQDVKYEGKPLKIIMKEETKQLDEVVVTGVVERKLNSFTGSAVSINKEELLKVGNSNIFQSLKNLDPSLMLFDNLEFGSDPNKMPKMQLRGQSSFNLDKSGGSFKSAFQNDPNMPLFVLDGFETSVEKVFDLDMNLVENVTILKDASAKAIYGSKAANGVIVITTKKLTDGKLRISFNSNFNLEFPDLSSYNLCNSREKLDVEKEYGVYTTQPDERLDNIISTKNMYSRRLALVLAGVDTDWMAKPLRNSLGNKHTLSVELGDNNLQVIANFSYNKVNGVMKGSDRETISTSNSISYTHNKFRFRNILNISYNNANDSPYGSFSEYSRMNPYWQPYDEYGNLVINAEYIPVKFTDGITYKNPLYNSQVNTVLKNDYLEFTDNFYVDWNILKGLKGTLRFGLTKIKNQSDNFYPANHLKFIDYSQEDFFKKGEYTKSNGESLKLSTDFNLNYSKQIGQKHYVFANFGCNVDESSSDEVSFTAEGFPNDKMEHIIFAKEFPKNSKPIGSENTVRNIGLLSILNYSYDERFLFDFSYRLSASSQFGKDSRWGNFWSIGLGWNIHNEKFIKNLGFVDRLKLRGSTGYTGSQNMDAYQAMATYNFMLENTYQGYIGAILRGLSNNDLKWQRKQDNNIGIDLNCFKKISLSFDFYHSITDNTLLDLTLPPSTGFNSVKENMGKIKNIGIEGRFNYMVYSLPSERTYISLNASFAHNKNEIMEISNSLEEFNSQQSRNMQANNRPLPKYVEGRSLDAIWAVKSLGIDPANGRELYEYLDGSVSYEYDVNQQRVFGNTNPKLKGNMGVSFGYKGVECSVLFNYIYGGKFYNSTLVDRVENVDINYNVDKRLFTERWRNPGDVVQYKSLKSVWIGEMNESKYEITNSTSRFIQNRNELDMASLNLSYDMYKFENKLKKIGLSRLRFSFYMNDIFKLSSIKIERGLAYPFAHKASFSIQATF